MRTGNKVLNIFNCVNMSIGTIIIYRITQVVVNEVFTITQYMYIVVS